jgi:hypothetical protein
MKAELVYRKYKKMITPDQALTKIPDGIRNPLVEEYNNIVNNYLHRRWMPSELSGGKFCEIVYTILKGYAEGVYPSSPEKPRDLVTACRALEANTSVPRSFQILIPRLLPALYEVRNNRGVGHAGAEVNPNHMDANVVLAMTSWIMAELIRVFHHISIEDAQKLTDSLVERRTPIVWQSGDVRRVLKPELGVRDQILIALVSCSSQVKTVDLVRWIEPSNRSYFFQVLRGLHKSRFIEFSSDEQLIELLPPGMAEAEKLLANNNKG